jgi:uncharacterized membrane protein YkvA (DUF1232 family)
MPDGSEPKALLPYNSAKYRDEFRDEQFWNKVRRFAKTAGKQVVEAALQLYYAAESPATPAKAKGIIYGALAYFISPIDFLPDLIPGLGYTDDMTVLIAALGVVATHITPAIKQQAAKKVEEWFPA